jgi:hypothetical protein
MYKNLLPPPHIYNRFLPSSKYIFLLARHPNMLACIRMISPRHSNARLVYMYTTSISISRVCTTSYCYWCWMLHTAVFAMQSHQLKSISTGVLPFNALNHMRSWECVDRSAAEPTQTLNWTLQPMHCKTQVDTTLYVTRGSKAILMRSIIHQGWYGERLHAADLAEWSNALQREWAHLSQCNWCALGCMIPY